MAENNEAKYASEAVGLFRLFNRVGRSFYGLLLLEIGWLFVLWLATKLLPGNATSLNLPIPVIKSISPFHIGFLDTSITKIAVTGGLLIFLGWVVYSRLSHYIFKPIGLVIQIALRWLTVVIFFLLAFIETLLICIFWPLIRWWSVQKIKKQKQKWIAKFEQEKPGEDAEAAFVEHATKVKQERNIDLLEAPTLQKTIEKGTILTSTSAKLSVFTLSKTQSTCHIGIAGFVSPTNADNLETEKMRLHSFSLAIEKLNNLLHDEPESKLIRYFHLPSLLTITNNRAAHFTSLVLGLDALFWGIYWDRDDVSVWLNIFKANEVTEEKKSDEYGLEHLYTFFPYEVKVDSPALTFSQDNAEEVYWTLVLAIIQILQARIARRAKQNAFFRRDNLYYKSHDIINRLLLHLAYGSRQFFSDELSAEEEMPSVRAQLAEVVGSWVGQKLSRHNLGSITQRDAIKRNLENRAVSREQLYVIAEKCSLIKPNQSVHFYRLGAIACLADENEKDALEKALHNFKEAKRVDETSLHTSVIGAWVLATQELESRDDDKFTLARFAAYAAYAINNGDEYNINKIKDEYQKFTEFKRYVKQQDGQPLPIAIQVIDKMLGI